MSTAILVAGSGLVLTSDVRDRAMARRAEPGGRLLRKRLGRGLVRTLRTFPQILTPRLGYGISATVSGHQLGQSLVAHTDWV